MKRTDWMQVPDRAEGQRVDHVLRLLCPELGLRQTQRLVRSGMVRVDGRPRPKGYRVRTGEILSLSPQVFVPADPDLAPLLAQVSPVTVTRDFATVFKPAGLHSEQHAPHTAPAAEQKLADLFPQARPRLVNRLDRATTGLLLVALNRQAELWYKRQQELGRVVKTYLAAVWGRMEENMVMARALETAKRRLVRVAEHDDPDSLRWTTVTALAYDQARQESLVRAEIRKGRRHQIRAHMAWSGHPIVGDPWYGPAAREELYLHHLQIAFPGFVSRREPDWPEWNQKVNVSHTEEGASKL